MPLFRTHKQADVENADSEDHDLAKRLKTGDEFALNEIMRRYKERIYRFAWKYMGNEDAALDVTQETFTKLYFNIDKFDPSYKFSTWLFQIALNLCRDSLRKNKNRMRDVSFDQLNDAGSGAWQKSNEDIEQTFRSKQELALLHQEIQALPEKLRDPFVLYVLEERPQSECADMLGVSTKTIETRVYRARRILAEKLGRYFEG